MNKFAYFGNCGRRYRWFRRSAHSVYGWYRGKHSDDYRCVRRDHRAGVPSRDREVHPRSRSWLGEVGRVSAAAVFFAVAAALCVALTASSASADGTTVIPLAELHVGIQHASTPSSGGWGTTNRVGISTWHAGVPPEGQHIDPQSLSLGEPATCGSQMCIPYYLIGFHGTSGLPDDIDPMGTGWELVRDAGASTVVCVDSMGATRTYQIRNTVAPYMSGFRAYDIDNYGISIQLDSGVPPDCDGGVSQINLQTCFYPSAIGGIKCHIMVWTAAGAIAKTKYTGPSETQGLCASSPLASTVCTDPLNIDGSNFNAVCGSPPPVVPDFGYFASVAVYYGNCLFNPVNGWDQNHLVADAWNAGPVGSLTSAFRAAVPSGIVCGAVAVIPVFGTNVALNTCPVDMAPVIVKIVIGWVIVLGIAALVVRRVLWSVGSKA